MADTGHVSYRRVADAIPAGSTRDMAINSKLGCGQPEIVEPAVNKHGMPRPLEGVGF